MNSNRGFAIALDALMAIILVTTIIVFLSSQPLTVFPTIDNSQRLNQTLSSTFTALDNAGVLNETLIDRTFNQNSVNELYLQAKKLLPSNTGLALSVTAFDTAEDYQSCRQDANFSSCFPTNGNWFVSSDLGTQGCTGTLDECITQHAVRNDRDVVYGKKVIVNRQAAGETTEGETTCEVAGIGLKSKSKPRPTIAMLDENGPPVLEFEALVNGTNPPNTMICTDDENVTPPPDNTVSTVTLHTRNRTRSPIDVVLVLDKSGSMETYDMKIPGASTAQSVQAGGGKCNTGTPDQNNPCTTIGNYNTNCGWPGDPAPHPYCGILSESLPNYTNWQTLGTGTFDLNSQIYNLLKGPNSSLNFILTPQLYYPALRLGYCGTTTGEPNETRTCYNDFPPFIKALKNGSQPGGYPNYYSHGGYTYFGGITAGTTFNTISAWNDRLYDSGNTPIDAYLRADSRNHTIGLVDIPVPLAMESTQPFQDSDFNLVARIQIPDGTTIPTGTITIGQTNYSFSNFIEDPNRLMGMNIILQWNGTQYPSQGRGFAVRNRYTAPGLDPDPGVATCNAPPDDSVGDRKCDDGHCCVKGYCAAGSCPYGYFMQPRALGDTDAMPCIGGNLNVSPNNKSKTPPYLRNYCLNQGAGDAGDYTGRLPAGTYDILLATDTAFPANAITVKLDLSQFVAELGTLSSTGGKCAGQNCVYNVIAESNCPLPPSDNGPNCLYIPNNENCRSTNETVVKQFIVSSEDYYRGIVIKPKMYNYAGSCEYATIGVRYPAASSIPVKLMDVRAVSQNGTTGFQTEFGLNAKSIYLYRNQSITPPIPAGPYEVFGWAPTTAGPSLMDVNFYEQRMDAAQQAAGNFIDNPHWSELDNIGIVSYSTTASSDTNLLEASPANKAILKASMNNLTPSGETWTEGGILTATELLTADSGNSKYIVLLSDGLSNLPTGTGPESARLAAQSAADEGITIFTIAFGNEALQPDGTCSTDLQTIASVTGGECYPASDPNQLRQIYEIIAAQIQQTLGNTNLIMPLPAGTSIKDPQCLDADGNPSAAECLNGIFLRVDNNSSSYTETEWPTNWHRVNSTNESMVFKGIAINKSADEWWTATFKVAVPCNSAFCIGNLTLPPASTYIEETRWRIPWPSDDGNGTKEQQTITIQKKDLRFKFLNGTITDNSVDLNVEIKNTGNYPIDFASYPTQGDGQITCTNGTIVQIYRNISEPPTFNNPIPPTSGWLASSCVQPQNPMDVNAASIQIISIPNVAEAGEGYLYGIIQPNFPECRQNNWDKILCFSNPKTRFFLVEYWGWIK